MKFSEFRYNKRLWITVAILGFGGLVIGSALLLNVLFGTKTDTQQTVKDNTSTGQMAAGSDSGEGVSLSGSVLSLIGSVSSTPTVTGLTLRINQIDICQSPSLTAYVAVTAQSGDVSTMNGSNVTVYVDGKQIDHPQFSAVSLSQQPLSVTLVIDKSGSMEGAPFEQAKAAATSFIGKAAANDQIAVIQFNHSVEVLQTLTTDKNAARQAVQRVTLGGDTALYDAIGKGIEVTSGCGRRAIVVLSDGGDRMSGTYQKDTVLNAANHAGIPLFMVGLKGTTYDSAALRTMAEGTGAQLFETDSAAQLTELYSQIDKQLKGQYAIALKLDGVTKDGSEHRLRVITTYGGSETTSERSFVY